MAWKKPAIYLTNGKKTFCGLCNCDMILVNKEFEMKQVGGNETISVSEEILFCPECKKFFITQEMSRALVRKHPGYYVDTSLYDLRPSKKEKKKQTVQHGDAINAAANNKGHTQTANPNSNTFINHAVQTRDNSDNNIRSIGLNAQIYLSNTYSAANNICPLCHSVLSRENVNIPVIETTGDFFRYYTESVRFCHKCRKAFISKETITSILTKVNSTSSNPKTLKIENATIQRDNSNQKYLFNPTLDNSYAIFFPGQDYERRRESTSDEMELNPQSFLGEMGYSTSKGINVRRHILTEAIKTYGKRKVCDHLAFLISMRKAQVNGAVKYANALKIWQDDLNYISAKDTDIVL